jgi:hypothetical protein
MKYILILTAIIIIITSCKKEFFAEPENSNEVVFEQFWKGFDKYYPEFQSKKINWDSVYAIYRPQVNSNTTSKQLYDVMRNMLNVLQDRHSAIYIAGYDSSYRYNRVDSLNWIGFDNLKNKYLETTKGNEAVKYAKVRNENVGYIYIGGFEFDDNNYSIIDDIVSEFGNFSGIIIDVRQNEGGALRNAETIASRFADQKRLYKYNRLRTNTLNNDLTDYLPYYIAPKGNKQFTKKTILITNSSSFSAAEELTLMFKSFPYVLHIGDETQGGSGTTPIGIELANGWAYRVSSIQLLTTNKQPITNGIEPNIKIGISQQDINLNNDRILEKAIELAK